MKTYCSQQTTSGVRHITVNGEPLPVYLDDALALSILIDFYDEYELMMAYLRGAHTPSIRTPLAWYYHDTFVGHIAA